MLPQTVPQDLGSMDKLLLVRMLDEDVGTKELGLDPSPPFSFLPDLEPGTAEPGTRRAPKELLPNQAKAGVSDGRE